MARIYIVRNIDETEEGRHLHTNNSFYTQSASLLYSRVLPSERARPDEGVPHQLDDADREEEAVVFRGE